jgi:hypothetical protein
VPASRLRLRHLARNWSITSRLSVLYGASGVALLALVIAIAYWSMLANLDNADRKFIDDKIQLLQGILDEHGGDPILLRQEVEWEQAPARASHYYASIGSAGTERQNLFLTQ